MIHHVDKLRQGRRTVHSKESV